MLDQRVKCRQRLVPVLKHGGDSRFQLGRVAAGAALGLGGVRDARVRRRVVLPDRRLLPLVPRVVGERAQREDRVDLVAPENAPQPVVPVVDDPRVVLVLLAAGLAVYRVQERVDQQIAAGEPELRHQPLGTMAGLADQDPPNDRLGLGGVLPDHKQPRAPVEPSAVEQRAPLDAERLRRIHIGAGIACDERSVRLAHRTGVVLMRHRKTVVWACAPRAHAARSLSPNGPPCTVGIFLTCPPRSVPPTRRARSTPPRVPSGRSPAGS